MKLLFICSILLLSSFIQPALANNYLAQLQHQAETQALANSSGWLALGHYRATMTGGWQSEADDQQFFFDENGVTDPAAELQATLSALFSPVKEDNAEHPQCRFPARLYWLTEQLQIDPQQLPAPSCSEYQEWLKTINPGSATLVFPAAYINSPSSMFGHTLLRIDPADQRSETPLITYALNYAAQMNESDNGFVFAFKGIFGGYPGSFALVPYYEKIKEYSDMENRDIWEYQLNLSQAEVRQLMRHAWEVHQVRFDYFFFDENCSYRLLALLDVARPGLELANQFTFAAIPADTVRTVEQAGLYSAINYRPSTTTTLNHRLQLLDENQQQQLSALMEGEASTGHTARQHARQLELGYDLLLYNIRGSGEVRDPRTGLAYELLKQRSELEQSAEWPEPPTKVRAENGHLSSRAALTFGRSGEHNFTALRYRPSYHDILDPSAGYGIGMQINFSDFNIRYYPSTEQFDLEEWRIIDILSLSPRNAFFSPISWGVDFGVQRQLLHGSELHPIQVTPKTGVSYQLGQHWQGSAMAQLQLSAHRQFQDQVNVGTGPRLSLLYHHPNLHSELLLSGLEFIGEERERYWKLNWQLNIPIAAQQGLRLRAERQQHDQHYSSEFEFAWQWYF